MTEDYDCCNMFHRDNNGSFWFQIMSSESDRLDFHGWGEEEPNSGSRSPSQSHLSSQTQSPQPGCSNESSRPRSRSPSRSESHQSLPQSQSDDEGSKEEVIWFPAKKVLTSVSSAVWNFFQLKGTKVKGPNKNWVFCKLCPIRTLLELMSNI